MKKTSTADVTPMPPVPPSFEDILKLIEFHQRKAMELMMQLNRTHTDGLYKKNGLTSEQFSAAIRKRLQRRD